MKILPVMLALGILSSLLSSCGEDPEMKVRREAQTRKIVELESRIAVLRERMRTPLPDKTPDLEAARRAAETTQKNVEAKGIDFARIQATVEVAEQEFEDFQKKHKISGGSTR
jgi:uncharacterized protein YhaN